MGITKVTVAAAGAILMIVGSAANAETPNIEKPMINHMGDAVTQPLKDVNLKKEKIPARLLVIQQDPYSLENMGGCRAITTEIASLYPMLGPDVNEPDTRSKTEKRERGISRVAGGIIGSFIPFRGIIRELSGANASDERYLRALYAGFARRSFLKGIAANKGCSSGTGPTDLTLLARP